MGGWADGIKTKEIGTHALVDVVWIGYKQRAIDMAAGIDELETTLAIEPRDGEQVWTVLDMDMWRELINQAERAIAFLEGRDEEDAADD